MGLTTTRVYYQCIVYIQKVMKRKINGFSMMEIRGDVRVEGERVEMQIKNILIIFFMMFS